MRVAVVYYAHTNDRKLLELSQGLARGISANGHDVDIINAKVQGGDKKLSFYEYLAVGTEAVTAFGGTIPEGITQYLKQSGTLSGKRCFAFVLKKSLRPMKSLAKLMKVMEAEGMYLKFSEILMKPTDAEEIGKRLHVKRR